MKPDVLHPVIRHEDAAAVWDAAYSVDGAMRSLAGLRVAVMELTGAPDCVLFSSCSQALRIAYLLLTEPGDVVVPDLTFVATANAAIAAGRGVHIVDVEADLLHMSLPGAVGWPDSAAAVAPVELLGRPISDNLSAALLKFGAPIIVDAAQSLGVTKWRSEYTALCVSFAANKIVHGHQGGALLCTTEDADRVRVFLRQGRPLASKEYHHESYGENVNMNPMGAALALSQCRRIQSIMDRRQRQRAAYAQAGVLRDFSPYGNGWLHVGPRNLNREGIWDDLWEPLHMAEHLRCPGDFPVAMSAYKNLVFLPSSDDCEVEL